MNGFSFSRQCYQYKYEITACRTRSVGNHVQKYTLMPNKNLTIKQNHFGATKFHLLNKFSAKLLNAVHQYSQYVQIRLGYFILTAWRLKIQIDSFEKHPCHSDSKINKHWLKNVFLNHSLRWITRAYFLFYSKTKITRPSINVA